MDFQKIDKKGIQYAMDRLNNRPRKSIGFATPIEVFFKDIKNKNPVALAVWIHNDKLDIGIQFWKKKNVSNC